MPLEFDIDDVLRAQDADPRSIRARRPDLVELARQALEEGLLLLTPRVVYERRRIVDVRHTRIRLEGGATLMGQLVVEHLGSAREIVAMLCTVGGRIETCAREAFADDPAFGLALHGVGSAAVEALSAAAGRHFEVLAEAEGMGVSVPLSPGMDGWSVEEGQPGLFWLLPAERIGVRLTESCVMQPTKSLTLVLGMGPDVSNKGAICDYCAMRATCRHQSRYA